MSEALPQQIYRLRHKRGLTQAQLASLAEVSMPQISAMEHPDQRNYTTKTLRKLAIALGVRLVCHFEEP